MTIRHISLPSTNSGDRSHKSNLGFEASLIAPNSEKHDHPLRPASAYIAQIPPIVSDERVVACNGGGGPLGHPRVFINLDPSTPEDPVSCGYCGLPFVLRSHIPEDHPLLKGQEKSQTTKKH